MKSTCLASSSACNAHAGTSIIIPRSYLFVNFFLSFFNSNFALFINSFVLMISLRDVIIGINILNELLYPALNIALIWV